MAINKTQLIDEDKLKPLKFVSKYHNLLQKQAKFFLRQKANCIHIMCNENVEHFILIRKVS